MQIVGCLDLLTKTLISFDDKQDLIAKIDNTYTCLDINDSGGLNS